MPELPEIAVFAQDMKKELVGRTIARIEVSQPKCLNVPVERFQAALTGAQIQAVAARGKWLQVQTSQGWLLLNGSSGPCEPTGSGPRLIGFHRAQPSLQAFLTLWPLKCSQVVARLAGRVLG